MLLRDSLRFRYFGSNPHVFHVNPHICRRCVLDVPSELLTITESFPSASRQHRELIPALEAHISGSLPEMPILLAERI